MVAGAEATFQLIGFVALLMGAPLLFVGLRRYTYSGEVIVEDGQVTVHSGPFGLWQTQTFPCAQLEDVTVTALGYTGNSRNYVFLLKTAAPSGADAPPTGREAAVVGEVVADERAFVELETGFGGTRLLEWLHGEPLPRIC